MEQDALGSRPESPKKRIKSTSTDDSEAEASEHLDSTSSLQYPHRSSEINGIAPTRRNRKSLPDSSSERAQTRPTNVSSPRIQEEEVSSSENSLCKMKKRTPQISSEGNADSVTREPEDLTSTCDSPSSDSNNNI